MNKESVPLIIGFLLPILLVSAILLNFFGFDIITKLFEINIIYYLIILPFFLGFLVIIVKYARPS